MIVFCTTCKGRAYHIEQTLPRNLTDNEDFADAKFVLVDYNSPDHLSEYVKNNHQDALDTGRLVFYQLRGVDKFKMAHAKNLSHRLAISEGADILVNLDADNYTGRGFAKYVNDKFNMTKQDPQETIMWSRMSVDEHGNKPPRGISGRIVVSKDAFLISGGYDEKYEKHSPDDKDFLIRLRRLWYCAQEIDRRFLLAVPHNDKVRFREYPEAQFELTQQDYQVDKVNRVVNYGNIGCGAVYRNFCSTPTIVAPIPTRIFGIGMHKTGTTSLHCAFEHLGYRSAHWVDAHWAKAVYQEMVGLNRSLSLERYYAMSDLPFPLLYKQIDTAYPNSKFILTIRNENSWLESVEKHWNPKYNKFRNTWKNDPFTDKVHQLLYGQKHFDKEVMLNRYRQHNAEVMEYFKTRPNDLLVLDIDTNENWKNLCNFLSVPIPNIDYPHKFATVARQHNNEVS